MNRVRFRPPLQPTVKPGHRGPAQLKRTLQSNSREEDADTMCQSRDFRGISHAPHKCSSAWLFHGPPDRHILPACPVRAETGKPAGTDTDFGFAHLLYAGSPYQLTLVVRYRLRGGLCPEPRPSQKACHASMGRRVLICKKRL